MLIEHRGHRPTVDPSATVAPTAVLSGDVRVGPRSRILHGAVLTAEDGAIVVGEECVVMEHALVRGRAGHPVAIGDHVLIGPHAHVNGATIGDEAFIATGASVFPGASGRHRCRGAHQRRGAGEHDAGARRGRADLVGGGRNARSALLARPARGDLGDPAGLDFVGTVYGVDRSGGMAEIMRRQSAFYAAHDSDRIVD